MPGPIDSRANTPQPNPEQTGTKPVSRRTFLRRTLGLAGAGALAAAATAVEPLVRPFIDSRGTLQAAEVALKEGQLSKIPFWVEPYIPKAVNTEEERQAEEKRRVDLKTELNTAHSQFVKLLKYMKGTGYQPFVELVDEFLDKNGPGREEIYSQFSSKLQLRFVSSNPDNGPEPKENITSPFYTESGENLGIATQYDTGFFYINRIARTSRGKPDQLGTMLDFYFFAKFALYSGEVKREIGNSGGTIEEARNELLKRVPKLRQMVITERNDLMRDIQNKGLDKQWGLVTTGQAELPEPEEAVSPNTFSPDAAAEKPTEPTDNTSAEDPEGVREGNIP